MARRVTRKYEAGRRNGHYSDTPPRSGSGTSTSSERAFSRVKRKLQFGRKPPQKRDVTPTSSTAIGASKKKTKGVKASVRRTGSRLTREMRNLMDTAVSVILPVRLRSAMRKRNRVVGYRVKSSPEGTHLDRKSSSRHRSTERITRNVYVD